MQSSRRKHAAITACLICLVLAGCGRVHAPQRAAVRGEVWLNGQPLKKGSIRFIPTDGTTGPEAAAEIVNGVYHLTADLGPVVGTVRVEIRDAVDVGFELDDPEAFVKQGVKPPARSNIPAAYNEQSRIKRTVQPGGENTLDFTIETSIKRPIRR